jgi:nucleotide-binding universal stress UspA family protein
MGVGTRALRSRSRIGRTVDRVVRSAQCPVLVVRASPALPAVRTVLVGVDFSSASRRAAAAAAAVLDAIDPNGRLVLVHGLHVPIDYAAMGASPQLVTGNFADRQQQATRMLADFAAELTGHRLTVESIVTAGHPVAVIEDTAREVQADLLALGTVGRSGLGHLLMGSVAERILHRATVPVLTVRACPSAQRERPVGDARQSTTV